jgi:flagellar motility protein MotE (MotC chaperone)
MVTIAAVLGLKAFAMAESLAQTASPGENLEAAQAAGLHQAPAHPATSTPAAATPANQCAPPTIADMAGLSQSEVQVLQALGARRDALDQRATQMETQDDVMTAAERRLDQRLAELHRLESTVNGLLGQLDEAQATRVTNLVDVYRRMRAKDAAAVFNGLDDGVLVQVAGRMQTENLAEVMGHMQPDRARHLTQLLADRARPPTDGQELLNRADGVAPAAAPGGAAPQAGH